MASHYERSYFAHPSNHVGPSVSVGDRNMGDEQNVFASQPTNNGAKKPYRIVMENVTEEKKKLNIKPTQQQHPPRGYKFVPYGASLITNYCQEQSRRHRYVVYAVTDARGGVSQQVTRRGFHFKSDLVDTAYKVYGDNTSGNFKITSENVVGPAQIGRRLENHARRLRNANVTDRKKLQQEPVFATIQELFPKIPEADAMAITDRAFEEGTNRVGTARSLPLDNRVQLAVCAHIRHMHTHYDQALKVMDRNGARVAVEKDVIRKLIEWRGEGDPVAGAPELEEFFREVIVIDSDDEDNANKTGIFRPSSQTQIQPSVQAPPPVHSPDRPIYISSRQPEEAEIHQANSKRKAGKAVAEQWPPHSGDTFSSQPRLVDDPHLTKRQRSNGGLSHARNQSGSYSQTFQDWKNDDVELIDLRPRGKQHQPSDGQHSKVEVIDLRSSVPRETRAYDHRLMNEVLPSEASSRIRGLPAAADSSYWNTSKHRPMVQAQPPQIQYPNTHPGGFLDRTEGYGPMWSTR